MVPDRPVPGPRHGSHAAHPMDDINHDHITHDLTHDTVELPLPPFVPRPREEFEPAPLGDTSWLETARAAAPDSRVVWETLPPCGPGTAPAGPPRTELVLGPETPPHGLRTFDLGTIPASVTPPPSWRRAAAFSVGTAGVVVLGLVVATFALVGSPQRDAEINGLPAQPTQRLTIVDLPPKLPTQQSGPTGGINRTNLPTRPSAPGPAPAEQHAEPPTNLAIEQRTDDQLPPRAASTDGAGARTPGEGPGYEPSTDQAPRDTTGPAPLQVVDTEALGNRTQRYYESVANSPAAAHLLTTGAMRAEGPEGIANRYAGVQRVTVDLIEVDPNRCLTRARLTVVHADGRVTQETRTLTFSTGPDPKIIRDVVTR